MESGCPHGTTSTVPCGDYWEDFLHGRVRVYRVGLQGGSSSVVSDVTRPVGPPYVTHQFRDPFSLWVPTPRLAFLIDCVRRPQQARGSYMSDPTALDPSVLLPPSPPEPDTNGLSLNRPGVSVPGGRDPNRECPRPVNGPSSTSHVFSLTHPAPSPLLGHTQGPQVDPDRYPTSDE